MVPIVIAIKLFGGSKEVEDKKSFKESPFLYQELLNGLLIFFFNSKGKEILTENFKIKSDKNREGSKS